MFALVRLKMILKNADQSRNYSPYSLPPEIPGDFRLGFSPDDFSQELQQ